MGGCLSVSMSCDQMVNQVSKWLCLKGSYIHNLAENLVSLEKAMGELKAKRDDVQGRIQREEFTGHRQRLAQVQVWLTRILDIENQYNDLLSTSKIELERLCMCGFCSKNLKLSYLYGKRVILVLREVERLISQGEFDVVTEATPIPEVEELPTHPTIVGQETTLERVWNRLLKDTVGIVGLHGMGGVGKTTLLTQINNKFSKTGEGFDIVIWVEVSRNASVRKIQESIAEKLGLVGKEWDEKNEKERALDIHNVLRRKKFVLLLDDIWEKVNLYAVGVPYPSMENGCKVVFTTRSHDVCGRMGVNDPIEVACLDPDKAWDLFKKKVGENTLESHTEIPKLARQVADRCRGLPLALNVIGETMACKNTVQEWHLALDDLNSSAQEFSGMEDEILPILKYSYDNLKGEQAKSCFLYCSLLTRRFKKETLIEYWICEGFIDEKEGRERALKLGYAILGTLVRASLLEEDEYAPYLRLHDVVRDMGVWIASDLGKHKERCIVQTDIGLREMPKVKKWKDVRKMSLMGTSIEKISESPNCPELTTLLLEWNTRLTTICGDFFWSMPRLLVLDLSWCGYLNGLPEQISRLSSLRCLDLSETQINRLPDGFQELKMLIHLNLEHTKVVSCDGISNLSRLRTLKLLGSEVWLDMSLMKELQLLEHLEYVSINMFSSLVGKLLLYDPRVGSCIQQINTVDRPEEESVEVFVLPAMDTLRRINIWNCGGREIEVVEKTPLNKSPTSPLCFSNLSHVQIGECDGLKDLTWLLFAPNLTSLYVLQSKQLEEIISKDKAASVLEKKDTLVPFNNLTDLHLADLPELKSIFWSALPFPRLKSFGVFECLKLRKLPLDSKSILKVEEFEFYCKEEEWMQGIEWKDEATRNRFLPSFKRHPNR
ncbi:Disease resistance protein (NBS-LRR class) family [Raphanus sativus]|uniref:Disease resistance protein RFL1-like n=1 Tax=Raphanus sativus TaxID=3726 RepID=A0A9W3DGR9_RAPSA|nr:disease resistance protein RFL1-like [Raphanus sativus]KAJ4915629.1 Disease resistance protein (NBS-LRR class) family [Raphanus sativus]